ncbi:MAG: bifunctional diguanylate cyclase/phosphodiesterase [Lachnospiraceae bacterium]|nr:bifunctional diguanylate cyclase/phosphodiesterase [Lachnospiraceae bacterium]
MSFLKWIKEEMGFNRNTGYQRCYLNETNIKTGAYMSFIVMILEFWMIIRYVDKRPGMTFTEYFDGETNYLIFFSAALVLFIFSFRYTGYIKNRMAGIIASAAVLALDTVMIVRSFISNAGSMDAGALILRVKYHLVLFALALMYLLYEVLFSAKGKKSDVYGQYLNILFAFICLGFGIETSLYDVSKSRQILCFVTMVIFAACMLIWKPYISMLIMGVTFIYFYQLWYPALYELDLAHDGKVLEGDRINFFMFWIVIVMVSISIYQQRRHEATKDEELITANRELDRKSKEDDLTGIHNMFYFNQETEDMLKDPAVDISKKIFLFFNVENFKTYNDQFGYQAGNEYLTALALLIRDTFPDDPVARQSDDHFVVFADEDKVLEKAELVRKSVRSNESEVYLELKTGAFRPRDRETDPRVAIDCARYACSLIKNQYGKNFKEYSDDVDSEFHKRQYIVNHIDRAVQNGYIKVYYQPVVWADTKELCGFEALARWDDPTYGFLSPGVFIPVLEEYRQIHKLDACIFEQVCKNMREGFDRGLAVLPVSLNFSRLDFELMDAVGLLEDLAERYNIPKDHLHVEITESALTENMGVLEEAMRRIKNDGFAMWLDDFGAGYSSFNVLKDFEFDVLKIDMTFLKGFEKNQKSPVILNAIIRLADSIGMLSLTEGVETEEAAEFLTKAGCGRLQGYLFGKPMPIEDVREKIAGGAYKISSRLI